MKTINNLGYHRQNLNNNKTKLKITTSLKLIKITKENGKNNLTFFSFTVHNYKFNRDLN